MTKHKANFFLRVAYMQLYIDRFLYRWTDRKTDRQAVYGQIKKRYFM